MFNREFNSDYFATTEKKLIDAAEKGMLNDVKKYARQLQHIRFIVRDGAQFGTVMN